MEKEIKSQQELDLEEKLKNLRLDKNKLAKEIVEIDTEIGWIRLQLHRLDKNKRHLK